MHIVTFSALADFPGLLEAHVHAFPSPSGDIDSEACRLDPVLHDILTFETSAFHASLSAMLERDNPAISLTFEAPVDADKETDQSEALLEAFQAARKRTLSILEGLTDDQWMRAGQLDGKTTTVIGLVHLLCANDWTQLAALQRRLARCSAT
jgi:hypothetical protein